MAPLEVTMWPPSSAALESAGFDPGPSGEGLNLEHCARLLPHDNDTGGFFLALFEKTAEIPGTAQRLAAACTPTVLADTDLVPLEKCKEPAKLRASLKKLDAGEGGEVARDRRVWASADGSGGVARAPVDMPRVWVEDRTGGRPPGVIAAGLALGKVK